MISNFIKYFTLVIMNDKNSNVIKYKINFEKFDFLLKSLPLSLINIFLIENFYQIARHDYNVTSLK